MSDFERTTGLQALAERHGFGLQAVRHMLHALEAGGGGMAQFDHPEFGGMGQWFSGGMVMLGRMNDHGLKARVAALCEDLCRHPAAQPTQARTASAASWSQGHSTQSQSQGQSQDPSSGGASGGMPREAGRWWPDGLGRPASVGAQDGTRYAYFPESRRLAVEAAGELALYDTGERRITGASQQQGGAEGFRLTGPDGTVCLSGLRRVDPGGHRGEASSGTDRAAGMRRRDGEAGGGNSAECQAHETSSRPDTASPPVAGAPQTDILSLLERLADLHRKGVLTDAEFSGKKADLLDRL